MPAVLATMRRKQIKPTSTTAPISYSASSSSSSSFYPSSLSSSSYSDSFSSGLRSRSSPYRPRDHLERLILKHGYPTPVSLSSLRDLTSTSSTYSPPTPPRRSRRPDPNPIDAFESLSLSSSTRPIPIPRRRHGLDDNHDLPVTPLTGRFEHDDYLEDWERASLSAKSRHLRSPRSTRLSRYHPSMRSDNSPFCSPVGSPTMSPRCPSSPQPSHSRTQNPAKSMPGFHLGTLPRFHPAVYQSSTGGPTVAGQPPSPRQSRQHNYRTSSGSRDMKWQYRDLRDSVTQSPSAPRLDPLRSPGPVTPLALESGDYLAVGSAGKASHHTSRDGAGLYSGPSPDLIEKLIARENEKARQKNRKSAKGR
ncbi:uncharacterized protein N7482_003402 [Penicillium canariense]|uniref:Uncharacterized protein n=1 Tax=Penicillium canariense TaxID=189055 RepID=A0A9W9I6L5_9EURO|nr:uncharacterized protein N7482_003402 [Penicillium canariense]KAJ5167808.1 hypothetical protein N7482_003402 [Penicillium canariense]